MDIFKWNLFYAFINRKTEKLKLKFKTKKNYRSERKLKRKWINLFQRIILLEN